MMAHILFNPKVQATVQAEIDSVISKEGGFLAGRLDDCPTLMSLWHETLRYTAASASIRSVEADTDIGGYTLKGGGKVLVPYRQLHMDTQAFGSNPNVFDADRFLSQKNLNRSPSFRPFGGGITYCTGRILARWEVLVFIATILHRYNVSLASAKDGTEQGFPKVDGQTPTLGIMPPLPGEDPRILASKK